MKSLLTTFSRRIALAVGLAGLAALPALAQSPNGIHRCYTDEHNAELEAANPELVRLRNEINARIEAMTTTSVVARNNRVTRIVPTVVHIVHDYSTENIPRQTVVDAIARLNRDMARRNTDTLSPRSIFQSVAGDLNLEFRLATLDPNGNPTDGITRVGHPYTVLPTVRDSVKYVRDWDGTKYFNIWVVRTIGSQGTGTVLGYAQFPNNPNWGTWGVVILANDLTDANSRTLTHESGHCFNLYHTFQSGCGSSCASSGDLVCDTPPASADTYGCSLTQNSCSNDVPNQVDMIENYMSYDACQNMFTQGQRTRVDAAINSIPTLAGRFSPNNLALTGVDSIGLATAVQGPPVADFGTLVKNTCTGTSVPLIDASYNGAVDNTWQWTYYVPGSRQRVYTATGAAGATVNITFDTAGTWPIKLVLRNSRGVDSVTKTVVVVRPSTPHILVPANGSYAYSFEAASLNDNADPFQNFSADAGWAVSTLAATSGSRSVRVPNSGTGVVAGKERNLYTPQLDLSNVSGVKMYFKRALAPRSRTATADKLVIYQSSNCGNTWTTRLSRSMSTTVTPTSLNTTASVTASSNWIPNASDWVLDSLTVGGTPQTRANIQFKFEMTPANASALFIDDIQFASRFGSVVANKQTLPGCATCLSLDIAPNPATASARIEVSARQAATLNVLDATGRVVAQRSLESGTHALNLQEIAPAIRAGVYVLRLEGADGRIARRMVVGE